MSSSQYDTRGRPYATVADLKAGDLVECDHGFTCGINGRKRRVYANTSRSKKNEFFIKCGEGNHYLAGQLDNDKGVDYYVGIYKVSE